jgi:hypothetical protein
MDKRKHNNLQKEISNEKIEINFILHSLVFVKHEQSVDDHGCSNSHTFRPGCVTTTFLQINILFYIIIIILLEFTHEQFVVEL